MKRLIIFFGLFYSTIAFNQQIDLADEKSLRTFLDDKQFTVGNYGSIKFKYTGYDKDFGNVKFDVEYTIPGEKKPKKIAFKADITIKWDEFYLPKYARFFSLKNTNSFAQIFYNVPTNFELFENGELYYQDRTTITMEEYLKARKGGEYSIKAAPFKLCKQ